MGEPSSSTTRPIQNSFGTRMLHRDGNWYTELTRKEERQQSNVW
jgi:hypothetical protein